MPDIVPKPAHLSPHPGRSAVQQSYLTRRCRQWKLVKLALDGTERGFTKIDRSSSNPKSAPEGAAPHAAAACQNWQVDRVLRVPGLWHIAKVCCKAKLSRNRSIADIEQAASH